MKKSILNLGEKITVSQQKEINGGGGFDEPCETACANGYIGICGALTLSIGYCDGSGEYIPL